MHMFNVMFGERFWACVKMLYAGASCMVRVEWRLSTPACERWGIKQGCPLSGQLHTLAIEPFGPPTQETAGSVLGRHGCVDRHICFGVC
jgi:hypothetical protein